MQLCGCQKIKQLKVEADIGADPLWCGRCYTNLHMEDFKIPNGLKQELQQWINDYGTWIDWKNDCIVPDGVLLEEQYNVRGVDLTEKVKQVLQGQYEIVFSPSTFAKRNHE